MVTPDRYLMATLGTNPCFESFSVKNEENSKKYKVWKLQRTLALSREVGIVCGSMLKSHKV